MAAGARGGAVAMAARILAECPCESGCPSCVQSPKCGNLNETLDKSAARRLLETILEQVGAHPRYWAMGRAARR